MFMCMHEMPNLINLMNDKMIIHVTFRAVQQHAAVKYNNTTKQ